MSSCKGGNGLGFSITTMCGTLVCRTPSFREAMQRVRHLCLYSNRRGSYRVRCIETGYEQTVFYDAYTDRFNITVPRSQSTIYIVRFADSGGLLAHFPSKVTALTFSGMGDEMFVDPYQKPRVRYKFVCVPYNGFRRWSMIPLSKATNMEEVYGDA